MKKYFYLGLLLPLVPAFAAETPRPTYTIATVAGSASLGDGGPATDAQIGAIQGIAVDRAGILYLSDTSHHCVRRVDLKGTIATVAGTGMAGYSGDGGPATAAQLYLPYGLAVDAAGYLYIADLGNNRIRRVSPTGVIDTYAGSGGQGSAGDGGPATSAQLLSPRNLALDSLGNLYISEFGGHRVRKVTPGRTISSAAGTGIAGFRGDGGPATAAQLSFPAGLALDQSGNLYIADSQNQRIREVLPNGAIVTVLGGGGVTLQTPFAIAVDAAGNLLVADSTPTVHQWSIAGNWTAAAGTSAPGFSGDGGLATAATLTEPLDLALAADGSWYIADLHRVRRVDSSKLIRTVAGADYLHGIGDGGAATAAELYLPSAVALDPSGNLYVADTGTHRVRQVSPLGSMATVAGNGNEAPGGEGSLAVATSLMIPSAVAVDAFGNLLIVETGAHRVRVVAADGRIRTLAGTGAAGLGPEGLPPNQTQLRAPRGICLDRAGNVFVVDTGNSRVLEVPLGGAVTTAAGNGAAGAAGDGGPAPLAQLNQPSACAVDSSGALYIADTLNHRVRKVDPQGIVTTVAGTGIASGGGDEGPAISAGLNGPHGVAVDGNGDLYIADSGNHAIRLVTSDGTIHTIAGAGAAGFSGDGGPATAALLNSPGGIVLDGSGDLYVADTNNNRVRQLTPSGMIALPVSAPPVPLSVMNAASLSTGPVSPGEVVSIFGAGMGPQTGISALIAPGSSVPSGLANVQVLFDGVAAPLFYVQADQINAQVPYSVAGNASTNVQVIYQNTGVNSTTVPVSGSAPGVFPTAINQDGSVNSADCPAFGGSYVTIYATGEGLTGGANLAGQPASAPYAQPLLPVTVTISGVNALVAWAGSAPGLVGLLQVNLIVPGPFLPSGAAPLELTIGSIPAPLTTIWLQ